MKNRVKNRHLKDLKKLRHALVRTTNPMVKRELVLSHPSVTKAIKENRYTTLFDSLLYYVSDKHRVYGEIALFSLIAIGQDEIVFQSRRREREKKGWEKFIHTLIEVEQFYESIGGIVGYQTTILELLEEKIAHSTERHLPPTPIDLSEGGIKKALIGLKALPDVGELYPIGGAGERLSFMGNKKPLPAALLPFLGKTLLELLLSDVVAREYLYFKLYGKQLVTPIAMMTSFEKEGKKLIESFFEKNNWFNRPKASIALFVQPQVPVVTDKGEWSLLRPFALNLKPGGHGAIWKTALDAGIFAWLKKEKKKHLLLRQINNPLAATDLGLLAFLGIGKNTKASFGFAAASRMESAKEGVLALKEDKNRGYSVVNIEYTEFQRLGNLDTPTHYPANTNILYANLRQVERLIKKKPLTGLMVNMKSEIPFLSPAGKKEKAKGGRLESMMQNLSGFFSSKDLERLPTFVTFSKREKLISTTKKQYIPSASLLETPEGAYYDLLKCRYQMLKEQGKFELPPFSSEEEYLQNGPSMIFLYHPALGPFFSIIGQKMGKGKISQWGELQLDIAEVAISSLTLEGSLLIEAEQPLGHKNEQGHLIFSSRCGKCLLKNVTVKNKGIDRTVSNCYWKGKIKRKEALRIILKGCSEFFAENVSFEGNKTLIVPDGERWIAYEGKKGTIQWKKEKIITPVPLWRYQAVGDTSIQIHQWS